MNTPIFLIRIFTATCLMEILMITLVTGMFTIMLIVTFLISIFMTKKVTQILFIKI